MDLRILPDGLSPASRCDERRDRIEQELNVRLSHLAVNPQTLGSADEKNCEQMFGQVPIPVGYAGPLKVTFSSGESKEVHLPLATTEGALVASVNRGCKALNESGGVRMASIHHGITRSIALKVSGSMALFVQKLLSRQGEWKKIAEATSGHLRILRHDLDQSGEYAFLTFACDTDEAMGMNMVTIAAQAAGEWIEQNVSGCAFVTVAGNVDSDKKPSQRTHDRGRGYEVTAEATISEETLASLLKASSKDLLAVAKAKLEAGSAVAGAIGKNLHAANVIAALYLATGQDAAHVVEGSLADTFVEAMNDGVRMRVRVPALIVGIRGGGTDLPAQRQCLELLLKERTDMHPKMQLAESIGAAVLAGELSLLAAQAGHHLASAHRKLARS